MRILATTAVLIALLATGAAAENCMTHDVMVKRLSNEFDEYKIGIGLGAGEKSLVELYVSENKTWTVTVTRTNGIACIVSSGTDWNTIDPVPELEPVVLTK